MKSEKNQKKKTLQKSYWVYMIKTNTNKIYTGITTNVTRRIQEHTTGNLGAKSLKGKGPFTLLLQKKIGTRSKASAVEWHIKQLTRQQKERIIASNSTWKSFIKEIPLKTNSLREQKP